MKLVKIFFLSSRCASHVSPECNLGVNRVHILPPVAICPTVLDRQHSVSKEKLSQRSKNSHGTPEETQVVLVSLQVSIDLVWYHSVNRYMSSGKKIILQFLNLGQRTS